MISGQHGASPGVPRRRSRQSATGPARTIPQSEGGYPGSPLPDTLRTLYEKYREVEVRELLSLIPREGLRRLWRSRGMDDPSAGTEPASIERLRGAAEAVLPLPPYETWVRDYLRDRRPYLERMGVPVAPSRPHPVTVSTREVDDEVRAHLNLLTRDDGWVGFLSFHGPLRSSLRTGDIFRAETPDEILDRFHAFTRATLRAFLRSVAD